MKQIIICISLLFAVSLQAQEVKEISESTKGITKVEIQAPFADDIILIQGNGSEVKANAEYKLYDAEDEFVFHFEREGNTLICKASIKALEDIEIDFDQEGDHKVNVKSDDAHKRQHRDKIEMDLKLKVWIPKGLEVEAGTISGDITSSIINLPQELQSISGDVDITLNTGIKTNLECHSISGKVYADPAFDIEVEPDPGARFLPFANIEAELNGGGEEIELNTISGNIFIRKR